MFKRVAIKVGSNVLAGGNGTLNKEVMAQLVYQMAHLRKRGIDLILVSSGAVAAGKGVIGNFANGDIVSQRQIWSSVGQVNLINSYSSLLDIYQLKCAQILVTKEDFRDRLHYLNLRNCLTSLLDHGIIPIINENDAISVTELMFTDNDELSGLIGSMTDVEALFILSNIDGIFNGDPKNPTSIVIREVESSDADLSEFITVQKSSFGRGGMKTKYNIAQKAASHGMEVFIANGLKENIILDIIDEKPDVVYTHFKGVSKSSPIKKWIAHSGEFTKGRILINSGAREALKSNHATSVLPVGMTGIEGNFKKGDLIDIVDETGQKVGLGRAMYGSDKAQNVIGVKGEKPIIHYDYLILT
ncbi:glutamate 5-kinase [Saccharicrinis sp. FJH2]|uniref:glutamate 5-kinase n=1 Tax=Saccharicrinis sp. FJH65 TaxID=3344659 RepID=UPI0035F298CC